MRNSLSTLVIGHCYGVGTEVKGQQEEGGEEDKLKTFMLFFLLPQEETPPSEDRCLI